MAPFVVVTVSEEDLSRALLVLLERTKSVVEPAGAAPLAAALAGKLPDDRGEAACLILSGGNIDPTLLIRVIRGEPIEHSHELNAAGEAHGGEQRYAADLKPGLAGRLDYRIRIYPRNELLTHPFELGLCCWV